MSERGPLVFLQELIKKFKKPSEGDHGSIHRPEKPIFKKTKEVKVRTAPDAAAGTRPDEPKVEAEVKKKLQELGRRSTPKETMDAVAEVVDAATSDPRIVLGTQQLKTINWEMGTPEEWQKVQRILQSMPTEDKLTSVDDKFLRKIAEQYAAVYYYQHIDEIKAPAGTVDWVEQYKDFYDTYVQDVEDQKHSFDRTEQEQRKASNLVSRLDSKKLGDKKFDEEVAKVDWPPTLYAAEAGQERIGALLGQSEYGKWIKAAAGKTDDSLAVSFLVQLAEAGPEALKDSKYLFMKATQYRLKIINNMGPDLALQSGATSVLQDIVNEIQKRTEGGNPPFNKQNTLEKMKLHFKLEPKGAPTDEPDFDPGKWFEKDADGKVHFYDAKTGTINTGANGKISKELDAIDIQLKVAQAGIQRSPAYLRSQSNFDDLAQFIEKQIEAIQKKQQEVPPEVLNHYRRVQEYRTEVYHFNRDHVALGLSEADKGDIRKYGLSEAVKRQMRIIEKETRAHEGDTSTGAAAQRTLEYMFMYAQSPAYIREWRIELASRGLTQEARKMAIEALKKEVSEISKVIGLRRQLLNITVAYNTHGFPTEKMGQTVSPLGDEGIQFIGTLNGGGVSDICNYIDEAYNSGGFVDGSDDTIRYSEPEFERLLQEAGEDLQVTRGLLGLTPEEIQESMFLADELLTINDRKVVMVGKGKAPGEDDVHHKYIGGNRMEEIAANREFGRFKLFRWDFLDTAALNMYESSSYFVAWIRGGKKAVEARIAEAKQRPDGMKELVKELCFITDKHMAIADPADRAKKIEDRLKPEFRKKTLRGKSRRKVPTTIEEAAGDEAWIKERMMIRMGGGQYERSLMSYTYYDSGPMITEVLQQIDGMFEKSFADELGINMRVRNAYSSLIGARDHDARHDAENELVKQLHQAAKFNPIELFRAHVAHKDFYIKDWFDALDKNIVHAFLSAKERASGVKSSGDLVKVVGKRLIMIDNLIKREAKKGNYIHRIDWSGDLSPEHRGIVAKTLRAFSESPAGGEIEIGVDEFIGLVQDMSYTANLDYSINRMTQLDYWNYGYQTEAVYDSWLDVLEAPDKYGNKAGHEKMLKLSHQMGAKHGYGSGSLIARNYGDKEPARKATDLLLQFYQGMDQKTLVKAMKEITALDRTVYGAPWDGRAVIYTLSGLLDQAGTDAGSEWSFGLLNLFAPKNSPLRRLINENSESWSIHDRHEFMESMENEIRRNLHDIDHDMAEGFLQYVKIKIGLLGLNKIPNGNLWAKRVYTVAALAAVAIAIEGGREGVGEFGGVLGGGGGQKQEHN